MKFLILPIFAIALSGCMTNVNDSLTPSAQMTIDEFDGKIIIVQKPVSSASSISEAWHTLGFEWKQVSPDVIYLTAGTQGVTNLTSLAFNVDGDVMSNIKPVSVLTKYGKWSTKRYAIAWNDFLKVAQGSDVKMKLSQIDTYSVSSFGSKNSGATVNSKFQPFIEKVKAAKK